MIVNIHPDTIADAKAWVERFRAQGVGDAYNCGGCAAPFTDCGACANRWHLNREATEFVFYVAEAEQYNPLTDWIVRPFRRMALLWRARRMFRELGKAMREQPVDADAKEWCGLAPCGQVGCNAACVICRARLK